MTVNTLHQTNTTDTNDVISLNGDLTLEAARQLCLAMSTDAPNATLIAEMIRELAPTQARHEITLHEALNKRANNGALLSALLVSSTSVVTNDRAVNLTNWLNNQQASKPVSLAVRQGKANARYAHQTVNSHAADAPEVGAVGYIEPSDNDNAPRLRIAVYGVNEAPMRIDNVTDLIANDEIDVHTALESLDLNPMNNQVGSADYRIAMGRLMVRHVLEKLLP